MHSVGGSLDGIRRCLVRHDLFAAIHNTFRMLLLLFTESLNDLINIASTLLSDPGGMLTYFLDNGIDVHGKRSYAMGSNISSSGEQITGDARCNRRFSTSIWVRLLALAK